jgi:phosphate transport system permease protein
MKKMKYRDVRRRITSLFMFTLTGICAVISALTFVYILGYLFWNGCRTLDWAFLTSLPRAPGESGGGMANAIVGSGKLIASAVAVGVPVGFLGGIYLAEFGGHKFSSIIRYSADLLNGVPSIVVGIFVYSVAVVPLGRFSTLAGGLALSLILIPITMRNTEDFLRATPPILKEGALALGASHWWATATVIIPAAIRGILAGVILGVARIAGEAAPLLFTSFNNRYWSDGWTFPTASLPVMIFTYSISPYEDWRRQAWAAALVLVLFVLVASAAARTIQTRGKLR